MLSDDYKLTEREKMILKLLEEKCPPKEIASKLYVSTHTIKSYIRKFEVLKLI